MTQEQSPQDLPPDDPTPQPADTNGTSKGRTRGGIVPLGQLPDFGRIIDNANSRSVAQNGGDTQNASPPIPKRRGRPPTARMAAAQRRAVQGAVSPGEVREIMRTLTEKAIAGDRLSAIAVLDRLLGAPLPIDIAKRVEHLTVLLRGNVADMPQSGRLLSSPESLALPLPDSQGAAPGTSADSPPAE